MFEITSALAHSGLSNWLMLAQQEEASAPPSILPKLATIFGVIIVAALLGNGIARALKMKEISGRLTVVLLAAMFGLMPFVYRMMNGESPWTALRPGIDLAGGTNMVFQVYTEDTENKPITNEVMDSMVAAVIRRVNPSGTEEVVVRKVGADRIEVIIPGADRELVESKKKLISRLGSLEFGVLANERDHRQLIDAARRLPADQNLYRVGNEIKAAWRDPGRTPDGKEFKPIGAGGEVATRTQTTMIDDEEVTYNQFLVLVDPPDQRITGENLSRVTPYMDEAGQPAVSFALDSQGARNMRRLSGRNLPAADGFQRRLAILLDDQVHQAPSIREALSDGVQITGMSSRREVDELVNVLNAGALKVPIKPDPISEFSISPLLGIDVQNKGIFSIEVASITVFVFMLVYYLRAGFIADLCLFLNIILVMGSMSIFNATFTLPGLAGLVLTIGMAVDANVLIFERMREEKERGSSQRMAVQNGFAKAFSTIVDANVTTLITAVVLYIIGSDQVRGFAVALFVGIVMSMFSALFFGRLLFDIAERKRMLADLKMLSIVGRTNWDFIGKKKIAALCSAALIIAGMATFWARGDNNLDIDFTGGTMVTFELNEPASADEVKAILAPKFGEDITLERLVVEGEETEGEKSKRYRMRTKMRDAEPGAAGEETQETIQHLVGQAFEGQSIQPRRVTVEFSDIAAIPGPPAEGAEEEAEEAPETYSEFAGGHKVDLTFSEPISTTTAALYFTNELAAIQVDGAPKYDRVDELIGVAGTTGAEEAGETEAKTYNGMELNVLPVVDQADVAAALQRMQTHMAENPTFDEVNSFDSSVAAEMRWDAVMAILASLVAIVFYIWIRFDKVTFGLAAVAALVHDVLVVLGLVAIAAYLSGTPIGSLLALNDFKINLPMIAAFLTIVGYSLNDTIVVFDRIREVRGKNPAMTESMVNNSLNQTLSRTLLTSLTTLIVVLILYVAGGEGIHGFAFCLVIGVLVGTYSSIYVASPVLLWLINRPGSEIGMATAKAEEAEREKHAAAAGA